MCQTNFEKIILLNNFNYIDTFSSKHNREACLIRVNERNQCVAQSLNHAYMALCHTISIPPIKLDNSMATDSKKKILSRCHVFFRWFPICQFRSVVRMLFYKRDKRLPSTEPSIAFSTLERRPLIWTTMNTPVHFMSPKRETRNEVVINNFLHHGTIEATHVRKI